MGGVRTRDGNMPDLKEISFEYARQIASVKGLQPGKVRGTSTLRFTKGDSDKLQVITWDEFVQTANNRNLAVYESGGWIKLMRKHCIVRLRRTMADLAFVATPLASICAIFDPLRVGPLFSDLRRA